MRCEGKYAAVVYFQKPCEECDGQEAGLYNRIDCGCNWDIVYGRYDDLNTARLVAARIARMKTTPRCVDRRGGTPTGHWNVETDEGIVAAN
jgi:hypothetical protein